MCSGDYKCRICGNTDNLERKLATLRRFYDNGLSRIGWDKYSYISLRYDGQVVCK
jgi:cell division protein FtsQ